MKPAKLTIAFPTLNDKGGPKIFLRRLRNSIREQDLAQTTHFFNPFHQVGLYANVARNYYRKPYVLRLDGLYFDTLETLGSNRTLNTPIFQSIKKASGLVFQSAFARQMFQNFYDQGELPESRIILNGAPIPPISTLSRHDYNLPEDAFLIVCAANWRRWKRLEEIIALTKRIRQQYNVHLLVIGQVHGQQLARSEYISYLGTVHPGDILKYYQLADMLIHIAWLDTCPNTVIEAVTSGLPVLCSNQGGTPDIVKTCRAGIISLCDEDYDGSHLVDLYHPPQPDMDILEKDALMMIENIDHYKKQLNNETVEINHTAREYVNFIQQTYR